MGHLTMDRSTARVELLEICFYLDTRCSHDPFFRYGQVQARANQTQTSSSPLHTFLNDCTQRIYSLNVDRNSNIAGDNDRGKDKDDGQRLHQRQTLSNIDTFQSTTRPTRPL